jgi:hypothetical protein
MKNLESTTLWLGQIDIKTGRAGPTFVGVWFEAAGKDGAAGCRALNLEMADAAFGAAGSI